jgi:hypothetical protein
LYEHRTWLHSLKKHHILLSLLFDIQTAVRYRKRLPPPFAAAVLAAARFLPCHLLCCQQAFVSFLDVRR